MHPKLKALNKWEGALALVIGVCSQQVPQGVTVDVGWRCDRTCLEAHGTVADRGVGSPREK